jgi:hypothetical protein
MTWEQDLERYTVKLTDAIPVRVLPAFAAALHESIAVGSPITGSPGQPVGQYGPGYHAGEVGGTLRASWQVEFPTDDTARVTTKSDWAEQNEDGIARPGGGPYLQRSGVGGRHSVALTLAGAQRLLDHVVKEAG